MSNKYKFLIICAIIGLLLIAIIPKSADHIDEAAVNPLNGDIAIHYCTVKITHIAVVELYSKDGERLFVKSFDSSRPVNILFDDEKLYVITWDKSVYCYDRDGNEVAAEKSYSEILDATLLSFDGWESRIGKRTYKWERYEYLYEAPIIFRDRARLTITHEGETFTVYESE